MFPPAFVANMAVKQNALDYAEEFPLALQAVHPPLIDGNRVSTIIDLVPPDRWHHVNGCENPADCGSRGLFSSELVDHALWWNGPTWLSLSPVNWPQQSALPRAEAAKEEEREVTCVLHTTVRAETESLIPDDHSLKTSHRLDTAIHKKLPS